MLRTQVTRIRLQTGTIRRMLQTLGHGSPLINHVLNIWNGCDGLMDLFAHIAGALKLARRNLEFIVAINVSVAFQLLRAPFSIKREYHLPLGLRPFGYLPLRKMVFRPRLFIGYYR